MTKQIFTLLENPIIVIALTVIILAVILTQKNIVSKLLRKYLKLNTDSETIKFANHLSDIKFKEGRVSGNDEIVILEKFKSELIGGRPNDR